MYIIFFPTLGFQKAFLMSLTGCGSRLLRRRNITRSPYNVCVYIIVMIFFVFFFQEYTGPGGSENPADETPPKDEFKVAKWMKKNLPTKKTKFLNHNVEYFTGEQCKYNQNEHIA